MIAGRLWPQLGGDERYLDVVGLNYYPNNQWVLDGPTIERGDPLYRPFREILREAWERYGRAAGGRRDRRPGRARGPTGCATWPARCWRPARGGVPVHGICLYPILNYPGWDDDRHCQSGLWGYPGPTGDREIHLSARRGAGAADRALPERAGAVQIQEIRTRTRTASRARRRANMQPFEEATQPVTGLAPKPDVVCLSHLRWDFVFQRPQHLLTRFARDRRVFFVEEPIFDDGAEPRLDVSERPERRPGRRAAPARTGSPPRRPSAAQRDLLDGLLADARHRRLRALVLHADGAGVHAAPRRPRPSSTTAWTSCRASAARRRRCSSASAELLAARRPRVHRRPEPLRGQARAPLRTSTPSRAASTSRTSRARARPLARARRPGARSRTRGSASSA